jgi:hypothetical protein
MGIVQLAGVRGRGDGERAALRRGLAAGAPAHLVPVRPEGSAGAAAYCAGCAAPIEFGAVASGTRVYCSIECSAGRDHTA